MMSFAGGELRVGSFVNFSFFLSSSLLSPIYAKDKKKIQLTFPNEKLLYMKCMTKKIISEIKN
jgi:hypothetical protein